MNRWNFLTTRGNNHAHSQRRPSGIAPRAAFLCLVSSSVLAQPVSASSQDPEPITPVVAFAIPPARAQPIVGERLHYHGYWLGIPVGSGWIEVKELIELDGRQVYHLEAQGHSNELLSTFYPIHDVVHSYLDAQTLKPLRFEKYQREGHYRADEIVTFDYAAAKATYRSLLNQSVKEIPLPNEVQDLISAVYWFRAQPMAQTTFLRMNLYSDEKVYETDIRLSRVLPLELLKRGTFSCLMAEPRASFKGLLVKRGRLWAYLTADAHRLPLLVKMTTPWGPMSAVLDEESIPPSVHRIS